MLIFSSTTQYTSEISSTSHHINYTSNLYQLSCQMCSRLLTLYLLFFQLMNVINSLFLVSVCLHFSLIGLPGMGPSVKIAISSGLAMTRSFLLFDVVYYYGKEIKQISRVSEFDNLIEIHGSNFIILTDTKKSLFDLIDNILFLSST